MSTYSIPAGTVCSIAPDDDKRQWKAHTTSKPLEFTGYRTKLSGAYTFQRGGWLLLIRADKVTRESK